MHIAIICYTGGHRQLECYSADKDGVDTHIYGDSPIIMKTIDRKCATAIIDHMSSLGLKRLSGIGYLIEYHLTDEKEIALFLLRHK